LYQLSVSFLACLLKHVSETVFNVEEREEGGSEGLYDRHKRDWKEIGEKR
jgi:hypothetical protein